MIGQFPWDPFPSGTPLPKGPDPIPALAYQAAMGAADAYRGVREAVKLDGPAVRIGNRFVPLARYRGVAFVAAGASAGAMAHALHDAIGDRVTQGFTAGTSPIPEQVEFQHLPVARDHVGDPAAETVAASALELAQGLTEQELLVVLLSPGAIGALAAPPRGLSGTDFHELLTSAFSRGANGREVDLLARVLGEGAVGGRLEAAAQHVDVATFVVDRGHGARLLGGGPMHPVLRAEREEARALLARTGLLGGLPAPVTAALAPDGGGSPSLPRHRPVRVAGPNDALRAAGDSIFEKKWRSRLGMLQIPGGPEEAAEAFLSRVEQVVATEPGLEVDRSVGLAVFGMTTLGQPEGVDDGPALGRFLAYAQAHRRRREMSLALLRTGGARPGEPFPAGAVVGPPTDPEASAHPDRARGIPMLSGVTDVGAIALALLPTSEPARRASG